MSTAEPTSADAPLRAQQQALAAALADGAPPPPGLLRAAPCGGAARVDVYAHAYAARLTAALRDNLGTLARALGDDGFDALARAYLRAHPSRQPSIRWFGDGLAGFMAGCLAADDPLVPHPAQVDLARLDWALRTAFDAADAEPIEAGALQAVAPADWPRLALRLHPSVQWLALDWAVGPAWHALQPADAAGSAAEPQLSAPTALAHTVLVWRRGLDTRWRSTAALEAALLPAVADGQPLAALCALAAQGHVAGPADADATLVQVVGLLQQWLADGLLVGVRLADG